jgi:hypothetical protein
MTIHEIQNNILEIIDNQENFSRGDLQSAIEAQVMIAYNLGKNSIDFESGLEISKDIKYQ